MVRILSISGYQEAIASLYVTNKNLNTEKLNEIRLDVEESTDRWGKVINPTYGFSKGMDNIIKYGIKHEHETILDFIKISVFMEDIHRGAADDFDSHARRMDIIRSSTRASKKGTNGVELSSWYEDKILPFSKYKDMMPYGINFNIEDVSSSKYKFILTELGYIREDLVSNPDVRRGLFPLGGATDNISTMSFRNWRHVYHLRRKGTHANPELQEYVEEFREKLTEYNPWLGKYLGKVWTEDGYVERNNIVIRRKNNS